MEMPKKKTNFTQRKLRDKVFNVSDKEHHVFMPNEIFDELKGYRNDDGEYIEGFYDEKGNPVKGFKSPSHVAYAYSYVYLAHYMYRYCKYYLPYIEGVGVKNIDEAMIKQVLGASATSKTYDYITKKGGVLDKLGYLRKDKDKPTDFVYLKYYDPIKKKEVNEGISYFVMESNYPEVYGNQKNRKINYPVKAFYRASWAEDEEYQNGTFWEIENTHNIDFDIFMYCMSDAELGVVGFYLYSWMKYMNDRFGGSFDCSRKRFMLLTELSLDIIKAQLKYLEERNMITNDHKPFCVDKQDWQITKANTYTINEYDSFVQYKDNHIKIPAQRKVSAEIYASEIGFVNYDDDNDVNDDNYDSKKKTKTKSKLKKTSDMTDKEREDLFMGESPFK